MLSPEKVAAAINELRSAQPDTPELMMIAAAAEFLLPQLLPHLPDDPAVLDHWLSMAADQLAGLRSDEDPAPHELPAAETV
jgi:hypothetical protein